MAVGKPTKMVHSRHLLDRSVERIMFRKLDNNNTINSGGGDMEKKIKNKKKCSDDNIDCICINQYSTEHTVAD